MILIGVDCATDPKKTGLARGHLRDKRLIIDELAVGSRSASPAKIVSGWLTGERTAILALDAPLGWPIALPMALLGHRAGDAIAATADELFHRATDSAIEKRLGKRPLEVGANLIARTALAAVNLIQELRRLTGLPLPLAWDPRTVPEPSIIEVYPAATRRAYGAPDRAGSLIGLEALMDLTEARDSSSGSEDARDAAVCVLAAADFLRGWAEPLENLMQAQKEGWIWARRRVEPG